MSTDYSTDSDSASSEAARASDLSSVTTLLSDGQQSQDDLEEALIEAARNGDAAVVSVLLDNGAEIERQAVLAAVTHLEKAQQIFEAYLHHGWDINMGVISWGFRATTRTNYPITEYAPQC
jgi:hypothetical protein